MQWKRGGYQYLGYNIPKMDYVIVAWSLMWKCENVIANLETSWCQNVHVLQYTSMQLTSCTFNPIYVNIVCFGDNSSKNSGFLELTGCTVNGLRLSELPAIKPSHGFTSNAFHETKTLTSSDCLTGCPITKFPLCSLLFSFRQYIYPISKKKTFGKFRILHKKIEVLIHYFEIYISRQKRHFNL